MHFPAVTARYAGLFALIYVALSVWVVAGRFGFDANHGDGGRPEMARRIRAHANFAEYVPFALGLIALLEARGAPLAGVHALLIALLAARLLHPVGMREAVFSTRQFLLRGMGAVVTFAVIGTAGGWLVLGK